MFAQAEEAFKRQRDQSARRNRASDRLWQRAATRRSRGDEGERRRNGIFFGGVMPYGSTDGGTTWTVLRVGSGTHADQDLTVFDRFDTNHLYWGESNHERRLYRAQRDAQQAQLSVYHRTPGQ
jgi:hypothetical protein